MAKGKSLPRYIIRSSRGVLYFARRGQPWVRLETQFPEGAEVPFALHQERERLLSEPTPVRAGQDVAVLWSDRADPRRAPGWIRPFAG